MLLLLLLLFLFAFCFVVTGGLICFTIREDGDDEFSGKIVELESQGRWILVQEGWVPHYKNDDMPRECRAFVYKVSKSEHSVN